MRKILLAAAASLAVVTGAGIADRANALTATTPSGVRSAADSVDLAQDVRWRCRYDYWGRRHCWWEPSYRRYWRYHRPWRRW